MTERARRFGAVAAAYEQYRFGYPDEVVDSVLAYAGRPVLTALEIGAGTGKATRVFARRGVAVTATDPDAAMLTELAKHVPPTVATICGAFEDLPLTPRLTAQLTPQLTPPLINTYDLVFAAASLHWTEPVRRWARVAALLNPSGTFASFGGPIRLADPDVEQAVRAAKLRFVAADDVPSPDGTPEQSLLQWPATELMRSVQFSDVRQSTIERRFTLPAHEYVGHLSTISAYLELPASARAEVFDLILKALPAQVAVSADLTLHLARLSQPAAAPSPTLLI
ncbi:methyltransferase family protein [Jatrophihabitans sp. GAS493]|uniref:class I SAM-dependent methyltransferase n=1 Tax=Jatrophihabitans sp. GAS493 TaxID=1907575 RepID=UPI000BB9B924|nr:class I SAM-dependent methyltransferase [Jatrophihabitans sp. GAS493]SOD74603.1 methyltransferase family protein [Jatrophihabitans sp. GAS493]